MTGYVSGISLGSVEAWRAVLQEVVVHVLQILLVVLAFLLLVAMQDDVGDAGNAFLYTGTIVEPNIAKESTLSRHVAIAAIRNVDFIFSWVYYL